jgi:hypothetical protein
MLLLMLGVPDVIIVSLYRSARGQRCVSGTELVIIVIVLTLGGAFFWRDSKAAHAAVLMRSMRINQSFPNIWRSDIQRCFHAPWLP